MQSYSILKYFTLDITILRYIVLNRYSRNYNTLNLKIKFRKAYFIG
jgi:hypothetical protein